MPLAPLTCSGCRACCLGDTVPLAPGDDPAAYKTKLVDGQRVLAKGKDGNCVYLGPKGCKIYTRQPAMCRAFDCRKWVMMLADMPDAKRQERLAEPRLQAVAAEGHRRLDAQRVRREPSGRWVILPVMG